MKDLQVRLWTLEKVGTLRLRRNGGRYGDCGGRHRCADLSDFRSGEPSRLINARALTLAGPHCTSQPCSGFRPVALRGSLCGGKPESRHDDPGTFHFALQALLQKANV